MTKFEPRFDYRALNSRQTAIIPKTTFVNIGDLKTGIRKNFELDFLTHHNICSTM